MEAALKALQAFNIKGAINEIAPFGLGHINESYLVETDGPKLLLQKLNLGVFKSPDKIESNLNILFEQDTALFVKHHKSHADTYHVSIDGDYWRLMDFIGDSYAPETANRLKEVEQVAYGFGKLTAFLNDFDPEDFDETIPKFHELSFRLEELTEAVANNRAHRLEKSKELLDKIDNNYWILSRMEVLVSEGLQRRVSHNDTKLNNCLLSKVNNEFRFIIDLDTLGPGYVLYDFGDLMRTMLSPTAENELDESLIRVREDFFEMLRKGFIAGAGNSLSAFEKENLEFGGIYMTYIMAVRFLTDYLNGDLYYKTTMKDENFIRARNQLRLLELMNAL